MKMFLATALAGLSMMAATTPVEAQVNHRQWNQQQRIDRGYHSGRLTPREARRLQSQQNRIHRYEARSRWDGGGLSRRERERLAIKQDRANRNIYRQKHDRQGRRY